LIVIVPRILLVIACVCITREVSHGAVASESAPDAYALYARAREAVRALRYPHYLGYSVAVTVVDDAGTTHTRTYATRFDATTGNILPDTISAEERAHPPDPTGVDFGIALPGKFIPLTKPNEPDFLGGPPRLAPYYFFGLASPQPQANDGDSDALTDGPKIIGRVGTQERVYDIAFVGTEDVGGEACDHLRLRPLRDPRRYLIRDLWLAESDGLPLQIGTEGNFTFPQSVGSTWITTYRREGSTLFIAEERSQTPFRFKYFRPFITTVVAFEDVQQLPDSRMVVTVFTPPHNGRLLIEPGSP